MSGRLSVEIVLITVPVLGIENVHSMLSHCMPKDSSTEASIFCEGWDYLRLMKSTNGFSGKVTVFIYLVS